MPTITELSAADLARIQDAIDRGMPPGQRARFEAVPQGRYVQVKVRPVEYPEAMWEFMEGIAKAEIALRDGGIPARLQPDFQQRLLMVRAVPGHGAVAYRTVDGSETTDLARLLGADPASLEAVSLTSYAYDSQEDLAAALREAKAEHPYADFSRV